MSKPVSWKLNIVLFIVGQSISLFGSMLVHYAVMWHITLQTQSGIMMTLITAAGALPMFFVSPFAGVWADKYNKKYIVMIADASIAIVTLIMAVVFSMGVDLSGLLLICIVMRSLGQGVQTPAVNALIPDIVPQEHLTRVNGISAGIQSIVMLSSPMIGGMLLAVAPIHLLMYIDVITAAIGIGLLLCFVVIPARANEGDKKGETVRYFHEIGEGIRYVSGKSFLRKFLLLSALFNILIAPVAVLTPLQVTRNFGDDVWNIFGMLSFGAEHRLATIEFAFFAGMMVGGLLIGIWGGFKNKSHTMALSTFLLGLGAIGLGIFGNFWIYLACMCFLGVVMSLFNPPMMSTLQINVDGEYMGRVFSVLSMMGGVMMPLGMLLWGPLADVIAIDWMLVGTGALVFLMGFIFMYDKVLLKAGADNNSKQ